MSDGKFAVVTGAGTGVGKATAATLVANGWTVAFVGRRRGPLDAAVTATGAPERAVAIPCDISDASHVDELFAEVKERFGRIDLLFNNAGMSYKSTTIDEVPVEVWNDVVGVNLTGSFLCARAAFGAMRRQKPMGGRIINNGSVSAYAPRPGSVPYTATKHAITGLTRSTSLDGRKYNIACGQIDIGNAATDMTARMKGGVLQADGSLKPEPTMDVRHVVNAVVHMASAPKSNAVYVAYKAAMNSAKATAHLDPPHVIRNAPTKLMKDLGYGEGYQYDPDTPEGFSGQNYFPDDMARPTFYDPKGQGHEGKVRERLDYWAELRKKKQK